MSEFMSVVRYYYLLLHPYLGGVKVKSQLIDKPNFGHNLWFNMHPGVYYNFSAPKY